MSRERFVALVEKVAAELGDDEGYIELAHRVWAGLTTPAIADALWVEGYEAGQESVQSVLESAGLTAGAASVAPSEPSGGTPS